MSDDVLLDAVEDYIERAVMPLARKIVEFERTLAAFALQKGDPGPPGDDAAPIDYALVADMLKAMLSNVPPGKPGEDGKDAEVDYDRVGNIIAVAVEKEVGKRPPVKEVDQAAIVRDVLAQIPAPVAVEPGLQASEVEAIVARAGAAPVLSDAIDRLAEQVSDCRENVAQIPSIVQRAVDSRPSPAIDEAAVVARVLDLIPTPKDGESVHPDTVALMVREAVEKFAAGIKVPEDGKPGRDVLDLEILEAIDVKRSYPAGTFALHDGGTVLAVRDTDPLEMVADALAAGWKVTQDGIKAIEREDSADARTTRLVVRSTSGRTFAVDCQTGMQDQGVHRAGMRYRAGDCVTYDESYWTARRETTKAPPGDDWRLILKGKRR